MEEWELQHTIERGGKYPYDNQADKQCWTYKAARTIIADLSDRRGIKNGFYDVDEDIRDEIVESMAAYIKECHERYSDQ